MLSIRSGVAWEMRLATLLLICGEGELIEEEEEEEEEETIACTSCVVDERQ